MLHCKVAAGLVDPELCAMFAALASDRNAFQTRMTLVSVAMQQLQCAWHALHCCFTQTGNARRRRPIAGGCGGRSPPVAAKGKCLAHFVLDGGFQGPASGQTTPPQVAILASSLEPALCSAAPQTHTHVEDRDIPRCLLRPLVSGCPFSCVFSFPGSPFVARCLSQE